MLDVGRCEIRHVLLFIFLLVICLVYCKVKVFGGLLVVFQVILYLIKIIVIWLHILLLSLNQWGLGRIWLLYQVELWGCHGVVYGLFPFVGFCRSATFKHIVNAIKNILLPLLQFSLCPYYMMPFSKSILLFSPNNIIIFN